MVEKINSQGERFLAERQTIGKGFSAKLSRTGPVAHGCGHMMHYACFETYYEATNRRHHHQIARHHPEDTKLNEFVCPLCKALGNAFLPIVWKGLEFSYPGFLQAQSSFEDFLEKQKGSTHWLGGSKAREPREPSIPDMSTPSLPGSLVETMVHPQTVLEPPWGIEEPETRTSDIGTPGSSAFSMTATPDSTRSSGSQIVTELLTAYRRLRNTFRTNKLKTRHSLDDKTPSGDELCASDTLVQTVGYSIAAVEIQQRGVEVLPGMTLLSKIPDQVLTHLRILAETASSYISVGARHPGPDSLIDSEYRKDGERQHCQLFMLRYFGTETPHARRPLDSYPPLLGIDPFVFLVECAYGMGPSQKAEIAHLLRLCYLAEIVKVVFHMGRNMPVGHWIGSLTHRQTQDPAMNNFADFAVAITKCSMEYQETRAPGDVDYGENRGFQQPEVDTLQGWYMFTKKYALAFLRKCVVFLHVKYGVDFNSHISPNPDAEELDRLTEALRVPTFDEMCAAMTEHAPNCGWPESTYALVSAWIKHEVLWPRENRDVSPSAVVSHPGIFEMIGLPKTYDTLIEEATRRKCPTTGKELTDPVICLFCGELFCSQGTCCQGVGSDRELPVRIGGAQRHMRR